MEIIEKEIKIRKKGWFKVGYIFFDLYAKSIGPKAALTYLCIKGYEHKKTRCAWPSEKLIAEQIGLSKRTVGRAIKILIAHKLISVSKKKCRGQWPYNEYYLTYTNEWLITLNEQTDDRETNTPKLEDKKNETRETQSPLKNNNRKTIKETLSEEQGEDSPKNLELEKNINLLKEKMSLKF